MSETTERVSKILRSRLQEIEAEAKRLEDALMSVDGRSRRGRPPTRKSAASTARGAGFKGSGRRKRAAPGERQAQLLAEIREHPSYGPSQLAQATGVAPSQVYGLLRLARNQKLISKQGKGYSVKAKARG